MGGVWEAREGWEGCGGVRGVGEGWEGCGGVRGEGGVWGCGGVGVKKREWMRFCWL